MWRRLTAILATALAWTAMHGQAMAAETEALSALTRLPVREVTIFKDGHAFVMHQGRMPVDAQGRVVMDYLPTPVLGTFWPYSADAQAKLRAVTASQRRVMIERTALDVRGLIEANIGQDVVIAETDSTRERYAATIVGVPARSSSEQESTNPPGTGDALPVKGNIVLLKTAEGVKAVDMGRIADVTFRNPPRGMQGTEEFRHLLTLDLDWSAKPAVPKDVEVGMVYLQKGLRWIPSYKVTLDGQGGAVVALEATLLNELTDMENVTAHLVIGVPTFAMQNLTDPIALRETAMRLSQYFQRNSGMNISNAIMSQAAMPSRAAGRSEEQGRPMDLGPEVGGSAQNEDLFVFTVKNLTLKKGHRLVLPVKEMKLKYRDVYTLKLPVVPPMEMWRDMGSMRQPEMAGMLARPMVMHQLRLSNGSECPLTTAPALIFRDGAVLGQGLMTFTSKNGEVDLPITAAVDVKVKKTDSETGRTPNAVVWNKDQYHRIDLTGKVTITNSTGKAVELEVTRMVLGNVTQAGQDGTIEMINLFEDPEFLAVDGQGRPATWWARYSWPYWWHHFNGVGRITWKVKLDADKSADLDYAWHYFWR